MDCRRVLAAGAFATVISAAAAGQEAAARRDDFEFSIGFPYLQSARTSFDGGTVVDTDSSTGVGFDFDWRLSNRWAVGATLAMHDIDYAANMALAGAPVGVASDVVRNDLDTQSLMGHAKRYFGNWHRVAPYATAALGWVSIDTNIPTGPPVGYCWFDPWWGFDCSSFQPTHTLTELGTSLGVGVRWDFSRRVFLDASIGREWIDFDNADRAGFRQLRIAFGIHEGNGGAR
jgi:opacity protein-like surface antigen